jgi:hypothetical protein
VTSDIFHENLRRAFFSGGINLFDLFLGSLKRNESEKNHVQLELIFKSRKKALTSLNEKGTFFSPPI